MSSELQTQKQEMETQEGAERTRATRVYIPRVDILSDENEIIIYAELPGVDEQNVDITVEKDVLTINGYVSTAVHAPEGYDLAHSEYERVISNAALRSRRRLTGTALRQA